MMEKYKMVNIINSTRKFLIIITVITLLSGLAHLYLIIN